MRNEFSVHLLNDIGITKAEEISEIFSRTLDSLEFIIPKGRELALVITKLQEAAFFAKRAIAVDLANQK